MPSLQTLPRSIVQKIVYYVTYSSRQIFSGTAIELNSRPELLIPLLWVCRGFRDAVYSQYSAEHELRIGRMGEVSGEWSAWPPGLRKIVEPGFGLVSKLCVVVDVHSDFSGGALLDYVFPVAHSLTCVFTWSPGETVDMAGVFVERVKKMVPMVTEISVIDPSNPGVLVAGHQFGYLVSRLYQLVRCVSFNAFAPHVSVALQPDIRDLVHLNYRVKDGDISNVLVVARQSALTLKSLGIGAWDADIAGLVCDDGGYVEYPCLDTLDLDLQNSLPSPRLVTKGVLFPGLRRLSVCHDYPFADDTLFRGNGMTLEFLRIMPGAGICNVIRNVFTSHANLECVKIEPMSDVPCHFESSAAYLQFALDIAPGAVIRDMGDIPPGVFTPQLFAPYSCIRVLVLSARLVLLDVVELIQALPRLSDLYTLSVGLGELSDRALDRVPACMALFPSMEGFRCWHIQCWDVSMADVVGVLGVALVCPGFNHVAVAGSIHGRFMRMMEETIGMGGFKRYAPRLRRLLFNREF
ncbi:hypothetical protein GGH93_003817 [Coemansia aciculifera]|nr:hypothetical protein GGH93_003817 [Coemansia aciculifera]